MVDNAYGLELPDEYRVSLIFNVADLAPFVELSDLGMSPSQPGENGANDQARLQARLVCCFDDFNQGLFDFCFGHVHEDYSSLWTCFKV